MNENQNKPNNDRNNDNKNRKNLRGLFALLGWALVLTIALNFLSDYSQKATAAATTHEIPYSEFIDLVEEGCIEKVVFTDGMLELTPRQGFVYTDEEGKEYGENYTLFTMQLGSYDADLQDFLDAHDVIYTNPYVPQMSPVLEFMISYILPFVLMIVDMILVTMITVFMRF